MKELTLRELCETYKVSRRAVQLFEKAGVLAPTGKTNRGYNLYDDGAQEKLCEILMFRRFGFQIKEIDCVLSLPDNELRAILENKLAVLEKKKAGITKSVNELRLYIDSLGGDER